MQELTVGKKYSMAWPFYMYETIQGSRYEPEFYENWASGCELTEEDDGSENSCTRFFTANGEGKIQYEVMSIVKLPKGLIDRVVFKKSKVDPDGNKYGKSSIEILTETLFLKHVNSHTPFRADYEIDE